MNNNGLEGKLICNHCSAENEPGAVTCAKCGNLLIGTVPVSGPSSETTTTSLPERTPLPKGLQAEAIMLAVAGYSQPIIVKGASDITLGRHVSDEPGGILDLSKYNAHLLGVSRRHAIIRISREKCTIEDLGSANGTWLNENQLIPNKVYTLTSGDQIRLGHLILFIYLSALDAIFLNDPTRHIGAQRRLTPADLVDDLGPYLQAMAELQQLANLLQSRPSQTIGISTISVEAEHSVHVKLSRVTDAVRMIHGYILPWKEAHAEMVNVMIREQRDPLQAQLSSGSDRLAGFTAEHTAFDSEQAKLAEAMIHELDSTLTDESVAVYVQRLVPVLSRLILSPFVVSDSPLT